MCYYFIRKRTIRTARICALTYIYIHNIVCTTRVPAIIIYDFYDLNARATKSVTNLSIITTTGPRFPDVEKGCANAINYNIILVFPFGTIHSVLGSRINRIAPLPWNHETDVVIPVYNMTKHYLWYRVVMHLLNRI